MNLMGDHVISSLPCGHLFGLSCIQRWLKENQTCPSCRKQIDPDKLRIIKWDGTVPLDTAQYDDLKEKNVHLIDQKSILTTKAVRLTQEKMIHESKINNLLSHENYQPRISFYKVKKATSIPSIVLRKAINSGHRVSLTPKHVIYSIQDQNSFGISYSEIDNLTQFQTISLHQAQIKGLSVNPYDSQFIGTVSLDSKFIATSLRTGQQTINSTFPVPLFSFSWFGKSCAAIGGASGRVFLTDSRGSLKDEIPFIHGPPISSIITLDDNHIIISSPARTKILDLRTHQFVTEFEGSSSSYCLDQLYLEMKRSPDGKGKFGIKKFDKKAQITFKKDIQIEAFSVACHPSAFQSNNQTYCLFPDIKQTDFQLFKVDEPERDIWREMKGAFEGMQHDSPILDIAVSKDMDFLIATISANLLQIVSIPNL